jgi:hypothetical protein
MTEITNPASARGARFSSFGRVLSGALVLGFAALLTGCGGGGTTACSAGLGFLVSSAACKVNYAPVANAGPLQNVNVGKPVMLDGSLSRDKNNSSLSYKWALAVPTGSTSAKLSADNVANPQFTPDVPGAYVATLVVNDGKLGSDPSTVTITASIANSAPVANAGLPQNVVVKSLVMLDGTGSTDVNEDMLSFKWIMLSKPEGSNAVLTATWSPVPKFTADVVGTYLIGLMVNDGKVDSVQTAVTVTAAEKNSVPVANAGVNQNVVVSTTADVVLDGTASADADKDFLTYKWVLISKPDGSAAVLANSTSNKSSFKADKEGTFVATLLVNDGKGADSEVVSTTVTASRVNSVPVARVGADQTIKWSSTLPLVKLDGSFSTDADLNPLSYRWAFMSVPPDSTLTTLTGATTGTPSFTPDKPGVYVASLIVNDGKQDSVAVATTITVESNNTAPVANAGTAQTVVAGATATLSGALTTDAEGDRMTYTWTLTSRPTGSTVSGSFLTNSTTLAPTLKTDEVGVYVVTLVASDGRLSSAVATVSVTAVSSTSGLSGS